MKVTAAAFALATLIGMPIAPAMARDQLPYEAIQMHKLSDGSTVYVFKDGKMAKEDRVGRAVYLKSGEVIELKDGRKLKANGNEVQRLREYLEHDLRG